jgi:bis(5'-nucleosyl)-tetraphosphatase (symmetrical)
MSTWVIGDVQACFESLMRLLDKCAFDSSRDRLWFVGDLVNRGPHSAKTLAWVYQHRSVCKTVLGNHEFHLLMRACGARSEKSGDTLSDILQAKAGEEWLHWLRHRPILYTLDSLVLVHAGLSPKWSLAEAERRARAVEAALKSDDHASFLRALSRAKKSGPRAERDKVQWAEEIETVGIMTRMRMLDSSGKPRFDYSGPPESAPDGYRPWFEFPHQRGSNTRVFFGHWAALGLRIDPHFVALDSACVWGKRLTAFCLEDSKVVQQEYCD